MLLAYIVKAHKNPAQVRRMVSRLWAEGVAFLFTIDRRADVRAFQREMARLPSAVPCHWIRPRRDGTWSGPGLVQSSLDALAYALQMPDVPAHVFQISGQCYPIKPLSEILRFFSALGDRCVMRTIPPPVPAWSGGGWVRLRKYHYHTPRWLPFDRGWRQFPLDAPPRGFKEKALDRFLLARFPLPRQAPPGPAPHFGHAFWSVTPAAARHVLDFHARHPEFFRHHRHTFGLDEFFLQSILGSSDEWRPRLTQTGLHYCDWAPPVRPAILTLAHRDALRNSERLLARKFDATVDPAILDWIDANLLAG